jgi:phosphatidylserine/phosphatidylglycerophosphate/cardiolipin synthase-like enzyme
MKDEISVAVTGLAWMGSGIGSIESAMEQLFREAKHEILITSYAMSSAADIFLDWLEASLAKGILIRIAINKFSNQPVDVARRITGMMNTYPHFYLYSYDGEETQDLHAKVIVADRKVAIVGSSNISRHGFVTNHELALVVRGDSAESVATALDRLFSSQILTQYNS